MGRALGRECAKNAQSMVRAGKSVMGQKDISWDTAIKRARHFLPHAQEFDSTYLNFVRAYAKGSGVPFEDLFTLICEGERTLCTDVMVNSEVTSDGTVLAAHSEDWTPESEKDVVVIHGEPKDGPSFVVMTLGGFEFVAGMNSAGVSFSGNSLYSNDERIGVPKKFVSRRILSSRTVGDAIRAAAPPNRASSYNNNICHSSGEMYCVEGSATDFCLLYPQDGYLVHTNHYLAHKMEKFETLFSGTGGISLESGSSSLVRYNRATTLVRRSLGRITMTTLAGILSDHVNYPGSICCHENAGQPVLERSKTTFAVISDLSELKLHACLGNPCRGGWKEFSL